VLAEIDDAVRRLRGHADPERELGQTLARAAARAGLPARVGIASSRLAAEVAAHGAGDGEPAIVPPGREADSLAPLPLARLMPEMELAATLAHWGIRTVGELARLPADEVTSRLGEAGRRLHALARGVDPRPLSPCAPPRDLREGMELEWPLATLEPFLFLARAALDRLCRRLDAEGLGCAELGIALTLEPEGVDERAIALPAPTRDAKTLLRLVQLELEGRPPGAAVCGFAFTARPDRPREAQLTLFGPPALSPDRLATTLARLFALLGPDRAGSPVAVDGHRPAACALVPFAPPPPPAVAARPRRRRGLLAVRALRPPLALAVEVDARGRPLAVAPVTRGEAGEGAARRPELRGAVRVAAGPWRLEEGWWSETPMERDYWDVEIAGGGLWRIYRDAASGDWFADGAYD
jgi:protein ImuB